MADKGLIEKSTMEAIADWIREQTGSSAKMLPSEMIAALETIGGLPAALKSIDSGTVTSASTKASYNITHNLGERPDFYLVMAVNPQPFNTDQVAYAHFFIVQSYYNYTANANLPNLDTALRLWFYRTKTTSNTWVSVDKDYPDSSTISEHATSTKLVLKQYTTSSTSYVCNALGAGFTYKWICGKFA